MLITAASFGHIVIIAVLCIAAVAALTLRFWLIARRR